MRILSNGNLFKGVFTALVTPFLPDGSIDWNAYDRLLDRQLHGGVHGVVPCGTTGEAPTLTADEKSELIARAVKKCAGRARVLAGTGGNDTIRTIHDTLRAAELGADGALVVTPYYNKPSQAGLEAHFRAVADASPIPVILYNVPTRTAVTMAASTVGRLAEHPRIVGIKESAGSLAAFSEIRSEVMARLGQGGQGRKMSKEFVFLSGDDVTFWPSLACGGDGVISVASNFVPRCMRMLYEDWNEGRVGGGLQLHEKLFPLLSVMFVESNPVPVKTILGKAGMMNAKVRLPLAEIQSESLKKLQAVWDALLPHLREDRPREDIHG